jgi:uncharacterized DUF497 family protein
MTIGFEWSSRKARSNLRKHGVPFEEARTVFLDPLAMVHDDLEHSIAEHRELIVGTSDRHRLLLVSFVESGEFIRILSARRVTRRERIEHEEGTR